MRPKQLSQILLSLSVALLAGLLTRAQLTPHYDACEPASVDAVLAGGDLHLAPDCVIMLDVEREFTGTVNITGGMLHSGGLNRIVYVQQGANLTLTQVTVLSGAAELDDKQGGGIYNAGHLVLEESQVLSNKAREGGAIYNTGVLTLRDSTIARNVAERGAGIYNASGGQLRIENSTIDNNSVNGGMGGGIYNAGTAVVFESIISNNRVRSMETSEDRGSSGGIYNDSEMTVQASTISGNRALYTGGIGNSDNGDMTIIRSTVINNVAQRVGDYGGYGGGINNRHLMVIVESRIEGNVGSDEGIGIDNAGALVMTNSVIQNNRCEGDGCRGIGLMQFKGEVAVRHNYWGAADGPSEDGIGSGDGIVGVKREAYTPFLTELPAWAQE